MLIIISDKLVYWNLCDKNRFYSGVFLRDAANLSLKEFSFFSKLKNCHFIR